MKRNRVFSLILFSALSLWCSRKREQSERKGGDGHSRIVITRNHYHAFHFLAPTVAQEKGFFEGVTVTAFSQDPLLESPGDGKELLARVQADRIDIIVDARTRAALHSNPAGFVIIGGWEDDGVTRAKVVAIKNIKSLTGLRGKKVGASGKETDNAVSLAFWLRRAGVDADQEVTWVSGLSRNTRAAEALRSGRVDAAIVSAEETPALVREGYALLLDFEKVYPEGGRPERVIVATPEVLQRNPEAVKDFLKGMVRAYRLINDWQKHEEFLKPLWQRLVEKAKDPAGEHYTSTKLVPDGMVSLQALQKLLGEEKEMGRVEDSVRLDSLVNLKFMQEAVEELKKENVWY